MRLPEMPGMVFAGRVHGSVAREIIGKVKETSGKATWLSAASSELGFKVEMVGHKNYQVMDCDGWPLIARRVKCHRKVVSHQ
ncbi:MAG: type I-E CRISPR-associated endoribonuclease Cas2 [Acidiferrobacteraceae bacterium]